MVGQVFHIWDDVFVTGNRFRGTFHLSADSPGFDFVLEME